MADRDKNEAHPATALEPSKDVKTDVDVKTEIDLDLGATTIHSGKTDSGKTDSGMTNNNMGDNGKFDDSKAELGPKTPKSNKDRALSFELNAVESLLFFNVIRFNPCHDKVDWEKVAHASGLKNVNSAKVRFRQVIKKYKLEDVAPATPRQLASKRKAADGDDHGGDDGAPYSESNVPGAPRAAPCAAPRARPSRSGGRRKRSKKDQEEAQKSQPQVPQPQEQVPAPQAQLQDPQPQLLIPQYQPPHVQDQVLPFQFQTPQSQALAAQHQHAYVQARAPQSQLQHLQNPQSQPLVAQHQPSQGQAQFAQVPQLALEDYMASNTGGLAGQNSMGNDEDESWMEFLDLDYLGI
ncbi:hypothetical protein VPNG_04730 [Cytospora leucostoma]|uniref:Myb-like domain-containing protein n=1 Tax=Cytospora leucostoma TaxID=1230097 RepID=A0A423XAP0_9PEZI|nr:hypothetical protein VPNG_04730 [Cytospora leucostoma]